MSNAQDDCPDFPDQGQEDADGDGRGDACDRCPYDDADGDGICAPDDPCPHGEPHAPTGDVALRFAPFSEDAVMTPRSGPAGESGRAFAFWLRTGAGDAWWGDQEGGPAQVLWYGSGDAAEPGASLRIFWETPTGSLVLDAGGGRAISWGTGIYDPCPVEPARGAPRDRRQVRGVGLPRYFISASQASTRIMSASRFWRRSSTL